MKLLSSTRVLADSVRRSFLPAVTVALVLACLAIGLFPTVALAAPAAPEISGPTDLRFISHPLGFRGTVSWPSVDTATEYRVYNADTAVLIATVTNPTFMIYGMQGVVYRRYVVAVDAGGNTSLPSNTLDIQTVAPIAPAAPAGFEALPSSIFDIQSSSPPEGPVAVQVPYDPAEVEGDPTNLRLLHFTGSSWVDITTSVDTVGFRVIGETPSFSVFAIMQPVPAVPVTLDTTTTLSGPSSVRRGQVLGLTGTISPDTAPGTITIVRTRLSRRSWKNEGSVTVAIVDGAYTAALITPRKGTWRFVATYSGGVLGSTTYRPSTSAELIVTVR